MVVMTLLASFVFAQASALQANTADGNKSAIAKQAPDTQTAIRAERTFNVEGKIMGQLAIDRLDANWSTIVLPETPARTIDHVPLPQLSRQ